MLKIVGKYAICTKSQQIVVLKTVKHCTISASCNYFWSPFSNAQASYCINAVDNFLVGFDRIQRKLQILQVPKYNKNLKIELKLNSSNITTLP